jgi:Tol biopolymer transport system component
MGTASFRNSMFARFVLVALAVFSTGGTHAFAQTTEIVSISTTGLQGNGISGRFAGPAISGNGRVVAFDSMANTLVIGDTNADVDVFVHDRDTGTTERVSVSTSGVQGNDTSTRPDIDETGDRVVFDSSANNLVTGEGDTNGALDVFVRNVSAGSTVRVSLSSAESQGNGASYGPTISADGRYVCFVSVASNLVADDTNGAEDIFVRDLTDGVTERVSIGDEGQQSNSSSTLASISANGRWVAFISFANNLVAGDTNDEFDVFIHDRETGLTERVSVGSGEEQANDSSSGPALSGDGGLVVFSSIATNLVAGDTNDRTDIFVRDRAAGVTERVSVSSEEVEGDGNCQDPAIRGFVASSPRITPDGRFVAFYSSSSNLVPDDNNTCPPVFQDPPGRCPDVFVRDRIAGTTARVSISGDGTEGNERSSDAAISASGLTVAFFSAASNLVTNDVNTCPPVFPANCPDIFVHEAVALTPVHHVEPSGPASPSLSLNAKPNPTTGVVELAVHGRDDSGLSLVVYDVGGRVVWKLATEKANGSTVTWDGKDENGRRVDPGTYFGKTTNGARTAMTKITLLQE